MAHVGQPLRLLRCAARLEEAVNSIVTPMQVERNMHLLYDEIDGIPAQIKEAEEAYALAKVAYEIAEASAWMNAVAPGGGKLTVGERERIATLATEPQLRALLLADATRKAAQANATKVRVQADLIRSMGASMRSSMEMA